MIEAFKDPGLRRATPLRIEGDVIYGHFCAWGTEHTGRPGVTPPRGAPYRFFHLSGYDHDGKDIDVGKITLHTTHAPIRAGSEQAIAHYENTGSVAAYVRAGDDSFGGWFCGRLAKGLAEEDVEALRGSTPSGDWRAYNGRRELIGILAVNIPGFPIERPRALLASGKNEPLALVASGLVLPDEDVRMKLAARVARSRLAARLKR